LPAPVINGEEIAFENGRICDFQWLVTLTLDRVILHTVMRHSSTSTYTPFNVIEIEETFCGRTDGRTDILDTRYLVNNYYQDRYPTWTVSKLLTTTNFDLVTPGSINRASNSLPTSKLPITLSSPSTKRHTTYAQSNDHNHQLQILILTTWFYNKSEWQTADSEFRKLGWNLRRYRVTEPQSMATPEGSIDVISGTALRGQSKENGLLNYWQKPINMDIGWWERISARILSVSK